MSFNLGLVRAQGFTPRFSLASQLRLILTTVAPMCKAKLSASPRHSRLQQESFWRKEYRVYVNEAAGDNARMSLAGFFLEKNPMTAREHSGEGGGSQ